MVLQVTTAERVAAIVTRCIDRHGGFGHGSAVGFCPRCVPAIGRLVATAKLPVLGPGIYRLYWRDGGSSLAAVGIREDGTNWVAPTNWVEPGGDIGGDGLAAMERVERAERIDGQFRPDRG